MGTELTTQAFATAQELMRRISSGMYYPGEKIFEVTCAEELGVSRNTLREAFALLAGQELIVRIPHRGVYIAQPGREAVHDMYRTRAILEPGALLWGSKKGLEKLDSIVATAEEARDSTITPDQLPGIIDTISNANQEFHRTIIASAESEHLTSAMERIFAKMRLAFIQASDYHPMFHIEFIHHNREVADLIAEEQWERAAHALATHLTSTATIVDHYFDMRPECSVQP